LRLTRAVVRFAFALWFALAANARADVALQGIDGKLAENVRAHLGLLELDCTAPAWLVRWRFRTVESDTLEALEALGFYDGRAEASLEIPVEGCWEARIRVSAGDPVVVKSVAVAVTGAIVNETALRNVVASARAMESKPLDHSAYEVAKRALLEAARGLGYFDAVLTASTVRVLTAERRADIELGIDGGERYRFGEVAISQDVVAPELVRDLIPFAPGDPYRADLVSRLQQNLNSSGYFGQVAVVAEPSSEIRTVPVEIEVAPLERRWAYGVGVGYATDTGARLRADIENPRVNRRGHRLDVKGLTSPVRTDLEATYRIPHNDPLKDWFALNVAVAHEDTETQTSDISKVSLQHSYERFGWIEVDFVELSREDFNIADQDGVSRLVLFGTSLSRVWRNDPVRPTRGLRLSATLRGATQTLGADTDFAQARVFAKTVQGLTDSLRLLVRGEAGWTWKDEFSDLPPSVRYFAGGDSSVRGYEYQAIGEEKEGDVVGGAGLLTGSIEFDWTFLPSWSIAAFADTGSAYDRQPTFMTGVGAGLRWFSPIGAIRVDIAHPLDDPSREWRLHVSLGPDL
jgi:translocation and assembly module TamA